MTLCPRPPRPNEVEFKEIFDPRPITVDTVSEGIEPRPITVEFFLEFAEPRPITVEPEWMLDPWPRDGVLLLLLGFVPRPNVFGNLGFISGRDWE